ncbi:Rpn family recombination-promoting nuclease/putative transposase [Nostoc sp. CHAB 5834]|nr:Rpn family recombination-promoting nuclease/putative transposase [Nostoc sp. CHAB 5834]
MIDHDRLFKELLTTFFWEFIELFFPEITAYLERDTISFIDKEVFTDVTAGEKYETDLLVKARFRGQESFFLVHLEHQAYYQEAFDLRMYRYFARLYEKYALPVYPIALFSYDSPKKAETNFHQVAFPHKIVLQFNYDVIQLNRLNWREYLQQQNPVASALMAKMNIAPKDRPRVKSECLRLLATLQLDPARIQLISGFIDTYLRLNAQEEEIFQTEIAQFEPTQQEVVMQIVTSWMESGIQQGELKIIQRLLTKRIGVITAELQERLRGLSLTQLEDLAEALLDFSTEADLVAWLQQQQ